MLTIRLLGGVDCQIDGRRLPPPASVKTTALLVWLLIARPMGVPRRELAARLFPDSDTRGGLARLRYQLHALNAFLGGRPAAQSWLHADRVSLAWRSDAPSSVDVDAFLAVTRELSSTAGACLADELHDRALVAVSLYRGELAPGIHIDPVDSARSALELAFDSLLTRLAAHHAAIANWPAAITWATRRVEAFPWSESAALELAWSLAAAGERDAARSEVRRYLEYLASETVGPPSDAVVALQHALERAAPRSPQEQYPDGRLPQHAHEQAGLPRAHLTSFVGRVREVSDLLHLLTVERCVTIVGPGGVGKTRLATHIAQKWASDPVRSVAFVDLAGLSLSSQVLPQLARSLGVVDVAGQSIAEGVATRLRNTETLIVLDNCEHVLSGAAGATAIVLATGDRIRVLATSREAVGHDGEIVWSLDGLHVPSEQPHFGPSWRDADGTRLFLDRAGTRVLEQESSEDAARAIIRICRRLDGLPLGIEIVAGLTGAMSLSEIEREVDGLALDFVDGSRSRAARQRTLRTTIDWSYGLLSSDEQVVFRRLAVFSGDFRLAAARAVCNASNQAGSDGRFAVREVVDRLVDKSLISMSIDPGGRLRFRLLRVIRDFGLDRLQTTEHESAAFRRHARYYCRRMLRAAVHIGEAGEVRWLESLEQEYLNLGEAVRWSAAHGNPGLALRATSRVLTFWINKGHARPGAELLTRTLAAHGDVITSVDRAEALTTLGALLAIQGDYDASETELRLARTLFEASDHRPGIAKCQTILSRTLINEAKHQEARELAWSAFHMFEALDDVSGQAAARRALADSFVRQLELDQAAHHYVWCLRAWRARRYGPGVADAHFGLGNVHYRRANLARARAHFERSLAIRRRYEDEMRLAPILSMLGGVAAAQGDVAGARAAFEESLARYRSMGHAGGIIVALHNLGDLAWTVGDVAEAERFYIDAQSMPLLNDQMRAWLDYRLAETRLARRDVRAASEHIEACLRIADANGLADVRGEALRLRSRVGIESGDADAARADITAALAIWRRFGAVEGALRAFDTWAELAIRMGDPVSGLRVLSATDRLRKDRSLVRPSAEQRDVDAWTALARGMCGRAAARDALGAGRAWSLDDIWRHVKVLPPVRADR